MYLKIVPIKWNKWQILSLTNIKTDSSQQKVNLFTVLSQFYSGRKTALSCTAILMYWHVSRFGLKEIFYPEIGVEFASEVLVNTWLHTSETLSFRASYLIISTVTKMSVVCGQIKSNKIYFIE
jgi:hypothetical protein